MPETLDPAITVLPADISRRHRDFVRLTHRLYRSDPRWVAPLEFELRQRLWGANPFFDHATMQAWVAYRDGEPVGRISAQLDRLQQEVQRCAIGSFGMFECEDRQGSANALFATAESWLRQQGVQIVRGPFNLSVNEECGLLVEGFDTPPYVMMGHALPYYDELLRGYAYRGARDLLAYRTSARIDPPARAHRFAAACGSRVRIRSIDRSRLGAEFELLRDIFNDAWSANFGFVPFTEAEFAEVGKMVTLLTPVRYVKIAEVDGQPAAFMVVMPNVNEVAARLRGRLLPFGWLRLLWGLKIRHPRSARIPLMGVRKSLQNSRLGPGLAFAVIEACRQEVLPDGIDEVEMSWILEDNSGMRHIIETLGGSAYKRYRLYEKSLQDHGGD